MSEKIWEELLIWKISGARYDEHKGVELADLSGLSALRHALVELTKALWKRRNDRKRIPDLVEEKIDLRIQRFEDGCQQTTISLGRPRTVVPIPIQGALFPPPPDDENSFFDTLHDAAELLEDFLADLKGDDQPRMPSWVPREVFQQLLLVGGKRRTGEEVSIKALRWRSHDPPQAADYDQGEDGTEDEVPPLRTAAKVFSRPPNSTRPEPPQIAADVAQLLARDPAVIDARVRARLEELAQPKIPESRIVERTISGEVTIVDVDGFVHGQSGRVRLRPDGHPDDFVDMLFSAEHERDITAALHEHKRVHLRVRGKAVVDERGRIKKFEATQVAPIKTPPPGAPSEELFEQLAVDDPDRLLEMMGSNELRPALLTYAAEIAGRGIPTAKCVPVLLHLLGHEAAVVREGAIYGLAEHEGDEITLVFRQLAETDPSAGVRAAAAGALKNR